MYDYRISPLKNFYGHIKSIFDRSTIFYSPFAAKLVQDINRIYSSRPIDKISPPNTLIFIRTLSEQPGSLNAKLSIHFQIPVFTLRICSDMSLMSPVVGEITCLRAFRSGQKQTHVRIQKIFSGGTTFRPGVVQHILSLQKPIFWKFEGD